MFSDMLFMKVTFVRVMDVGWAGPTFVCHFFSHQKVCVVVSVFARLCVCVFVCCLMSLYLVVVVVPPMQLPPHSETRPVTLAAHSRQQKQGCFFSFTESIFWKSEISVGSKNDLDGAL